MQKTPRITFAEIIDRPSFSSEPVASFYDESDPARKKRINYKRASLEATIRNEKRNAELYPKSNARATLVQLQHALAVMSLQR